MAHTIASDDPVLPPVYSITRMPGFSVPRRFGALDHRERHAVLVRPGRVEVFELDDDVRAEPG